MPQWGIFSNRGHGAYLTLGGRLWGLMLRGGDDRIFQAQVPKTLNKDPRNAGFVKQPPLQTKKRKRDFLQLHLQLHFFYPTNMFQPLL